MRKATKVRARVRGAKSVLPSHFWGKRLVTGNFQTTEKGKSLTLTRVTLSDTGGTASVSVICNSGGATPLATLNAARPNAGLYHLVPPGDTLTVVVKGGPVDLVGYVTEDKGDADPDAILLGGGD
eukprot:Hpha_TRINITY_DN11503_c0_g1::TRINITY_DN11503_c0_g1_i2::g.32471::m.32471